MEYQSPTKLNKKNSLEELHYTIAVEKSVLNMMQSFCKILYIPVSLYLLVRSSIRVGTHLTTQIHKLSSVSSSYKTLSKA